MKDKIDESLEGILSNLINEWECSHTLHSISDLIDVVSEIKERESIQNHQELMEKLSNILKALTASVNSEWTQAPQKTLEEKVKELETELILLNMRVVILENQQRRNIEPPTWPEYPEYPLQPTVYPWYPTYPYYSDGTGTLVCDEVNMSFTGNLS